MNQPNSSISTPILVGVAGCFLLSGFAALLYQMAWMRLFSTTFGTSEIAVATVLSAYMGGLALGAALAGRLVQLIRRPVLFYGLLEATIAISALLVPVLLSAAGLLYAAVLGNQASIPNATGWSQPLFYFVVAFAVLMVPTACMGATLPVLTRYVVSRDDQIGRRVGGLYAINTLGAVCGAIVAGFVLLPQLGLRGTVWCGVLVNILVFAIAVLVARASTPASRSDSEAAPAPEDEQFRYARMILPIMTLSGVCTFVYEVLWTRLLSHILGGSVAAFALMLASFLSGIALGSMVASRIAKTRAVAARAFVISQLGIAATSVLIYYSLDRYLQTDLAYEARVLAAYLRGKSRCRRTLVRTGVCMEHTRRNLRRRDCGVLPRTDVEVRRRDTCHGDAKPGPGRCGGRDPAQDTSAATCRLCSDPGCRHHPLLSVRARKDLAVFTHDGDRNR